MISQYGSDPATRHYVVVTSNTVPLSPTPRALFAQSNGTIRIIDDANTSISYTVTAGQILPFRAYLITTDSTANVVAWY